MFPCARKLLVPLLATLLLPAVASAARAAEPPAMSLQQATQGAWDYVHFRELLTEALDEVFGKTLYELVRKESWFDNRFITQEEVIERAISCYVMSSCANAASRPLY